MAALTVSKELPVRRMEVELGQEMQIDFGQCAPSKDHTGKYRRTYVSRVVISHSRKGYTEAVTRLTTESLIRCLENAFRALAGVPKIVVFDNASSAVKKAEWHDPELNPNHFYPRTVQNSFGLGASLAFILPFAFQPS